MDLEMLSSQDELEDIRKLLLFMGSASSVFVISYVAGKLSRRKSPTFESESISLYRGYKEQYDECIEFGIDPEEIILQYNIRLSNLRAKYNIRTLTEKSKTKVQ